MDQPTRLSLDRSPIPFAEFVALIALMMSLTALGIDSMLPALPAIGESLNVAADNDRQYVITAFLMGFGVAQLVYGPLADRYGRKPVLMASLAIYIVMNAVVAASESFTLLLIARFAAGAAIASARVVTIALVRDCFSGRAMARVMSLAFIVFMAAPILAPAFGQAVLLVGSWRWIFGGIALVSTVALIWFSVRMPETLADADRAPLDVRQIALGYRATLGDRCSVGYTVASAALGCAMFGFIGSIQQVMDSVFAVPSMLSVVFAVVASTMAVASFLNSRVVMRFGTRLMSHLALCGLVAVAGVHLLVAVAGHETLVLFIILQAMMMAFFGLANSNFSAMAMENMGEIAGTASSVQGFVATMVGAIGGAVIGQAFDGTTVPLYTGFLTCGVVALLAVLWTEHGKLFRRG